MRSAALAAWCRFAHEDGRSPLPPVDDVASLSTLLITNRMGPAVSRALRLRARTGDVGRQGPGRTADDVLGSAPELAAVLRDESRHVAEGSLHAIATLHRVAQSLDRAGISWMLWKGPAICLMAWDELGIRHFSDLDVVVAPRDRDAARSALAADGWCARDACTAAQERAIHAATRAYPLERAGSIMVELHWSFAGSHYPSWGDVAAIAGRARTLDLGGIAVRTPAGADAILLAALHATKHGWSQAEDALLFTRLATREPDALVMATSRADEAGVGTAMRLGVRLAARLCSVILPEPPVSRTEDARVSALADECVARMEAGTGPWRETHAWTLGWVRRPIDRVRYAGVATFAPTPQERNWVTLPDALAWAYPAVRVARLALRATRIPRARR